MLQSDGVLQPQPYVGCFREETKMPVTDSVPPRAAWESRLDRSLLPVGTRSWIELGSKRLVLVVALAVGAASFLATELMHYLLVPDLGRNRERLLAEVLSAFIVGCLVAKLAQINRERHRLTTARMQVIAEMNHHIRNALSPISLSLDAAENQELVRVISEGVERIDWALREILPREAPLCEGQRHQLGYFQTHGTPTDERRKDSLRRESR
jgi:signal transduction histidine kinase